MFDARDLDSAPYLHRVEESIATEIKTLFDRFPDLAGFSIVDRSGLPDDIDRSGREHQLFVGDIGFCPPVSEGEHGKACNKICDVLTDIVSERPEAFDLLRGRTFSRTLH
jgi:methyl coenzyme M reductase subunit C-like uncharacterized protein (methanogenesis marker protein 7)